MHDRLIEAHARLSFLKIHLPETSTLEEKYILEFHAILHLLEQASGCDLGAYRIPAKEVILQGDANGNGHRNGNGNQASAHAGGNVPVADASAKNGDAATAGALPSANGNGHAAQNWCAVEPACPRAALMHRIDGVLSFFGVQASTHRVLNRLHG